MEEKEGNLGVTGMEIFQYGTKEMEYLQQKDEKLGNVIRELGHLERTVIPDLFQALVNSIVGQQISMKAQATVWHRLCEQAGPVTPEHMAAISVEELQRAGISYRKVEYIKGAAQKICDGELDLNGLYAKSDEEVCRELSSLPGIGVWTAEMLMIFSMQRPDVLSFGDLAIIRGMRMVYHHRKIERKLFDKYKRRYSPYGTVAGLYLWAVAGGAVSGMKDYAPKVKKGINRVGGK